MKKITLACMGVMMICLAACEDSPSDPGPDPTPSTMSFKSGARYEFTSYTTSPSDGSKNESTERRRVWTLATPSGSAYGRSNVAIYIDSVFSAGVISLTDTVYLQQQTGTNDIFRYASLAPELDFSGSSVVDLDLGRGWMHEARLNAATARWFVGEAADTVQMDVSIPNLQGIRIAVTDSAVASSADNVTIDGTSYAATKTTHRLELSVSAIVSIPVIGNTSIKLKSESLNRTSWTVPQLGAIVREERDGAVIDVSSGNYGGVSIPGFDLPVPGYVSVMTKVLAVGS